MYDSTKEKIKNEYPALQTLLMTLGREEVKLKLPDYHEDMIGMLHNFVYDFDKIPSYAFEDATSPILTDKGEDNESVSVSVATLRLLFLHMMVIHDEMLVDTVLENLNLLSGSLIEHSETILDSTKH